MHNHSALQCAGYEKTKLSFSRLLCAGYELKDQPVFLHTPLRHGDRQFPRPSETKHFWSMEPLSTDGRIKCLFLCYNTEVLSQHGQFCTCSHFPAYRECLALETSMHCSTSLSCHGHPSSLSNKDNESWLPLGWSFQSTSFKVDFATPFVQFSLYKTILFHVKVMAKTLLHTARK